MRCYISAILVTTWGLRDYGIEPSVWGGDPECQHQWLTEEVEREMRRGLGLKDSPANTRGGAIKCAEIGVQKFQRGQCVLCGAWRGVFGLEPTPEMYVEHSVLIFREVWRVLRNDGTLWLNIGDCYATGAGKVGNAPGGGDQGARWAGYRGSHSKVNSGKAAYRLPDDGIGPMTQPNRLPIPGLKAKDLVGIPWRVAFALQADGWYLRSQIIWNKPNPMPESVTDRPTKAHEDIFLLSKQERYYYDAEAIKEKSSNNTHSRGDGVNPKAKATGKNSRQLVDRDPAHLQAKRPKQNESFSGAINEIVPYRNKRTVWTIATQPFPEAHFATFPEELPENCIKAGTSEHGVCAKCGAPWERILEKRTPAQKVPNGWDLADGHHSNANREYSGKHSDAAKQSAGRRLLLQMKANRESGGDHEDWVPQAVTVAWEPSCTCGGYRIRTRSSRRLQRHQWYRSHRGLRIAARWPMRVEATVLDPFNGAGTTGKVARRLMRNYIGIDLNPNYIEMAVRRIQGDAPLFNTPTNHMEAVSEARSDE